MGDMGVFVLWQSIILKNSFSYNVLLSAIYSWSLDHHAAWAIGSYNIPSAPHNPTEIYLDYKTFYILIMTESVYDVFCEFAEMSVSKPIIFVWKLGTKHPNRWLFSVSIKLSQLLLQCVYGSMKCDVCALQLKNASYNMTQLQTAWHLLQSIYFIKTSLA